MSDDADAPFAVDTWPRCAPWQRAGVVTGHDLQLINLWRYRADLALLLEVDRRFDQLADQIRRDSWPHENPRWAADLLADENPKP